MQRPLNKVSIGAGAGALSAILAWSLQQFAGVEMPAGIEAASAVLIATAVAYFVPLSEKEASAIARRADRGADGRPD